jgi:hypothetical protein
VIRTFRIMPADRYVVLSTVGSRDTSREPLGSPAASSKDSNGYLKGPESDPEATTESGHGMLRLVYAGQHNARVRGTRGG